jgi:hypothetical protein
MAVAETILGIATGVRVVPVRVMNRFGLEEASEILERAFEWVVENRKRLGLPWFARPLQNRHERVCSEHHSQEL